MKVLETCGIAASKGNKIIGIYRRIITYMEKIGNCTPVQSNSLEYYIQTRRPHRKKDIEKLERIKRKATKMIPELRDLSYESCLVILIEGDN